MQQLSKFEKRKKELFLKITEIITEEGYENITIRGLCQKMHISTGTFYHYFQDKGDLIKILFNDIDAYFLQVVPDRFTDAEPDNLITFFKEYGNYALHNGVETCRCISIAPLAKRDNHYMDESRYIFVTLQKLIERGIDKKQFRSDIQPHDTARMIMIMLRGYSAEWAKHDGNFDLAGELEKAGNFICHSLKYT